MKKIIIIIGTFFSTLVLFYGCDAIHEVATNQLEMATNKQDITTIQVPKYTSIEHVFELKLNSTLPEVISTLGSKPYNIYSSQINGYTIYAYYYKLIERKTNPSFINEKGSETVGIEVFNSKIQKLYLLFKEGKLESFITTDGLKDSRNLIMLNNTVYTISSDRGKYIIQPESSGPLFENNIPEIIESRKQYDTINQIPNSKTNSNFWIEESHSK